MFRAGVRVWVKIMTCFCLSSSVCFQRRSSQQIRLLLLLLLLLLGDPDSARCRLAQAKRKFLKISKIAKMKIRVSSRRNAYFGGAQIGALCSRAGETQFFDENERFAQARRTGQFLATTTIIYYIDIYIYTTTTTTTTTTTIIVQVAKIFFENKHYQTNKSRS